MGRAFPCPMQARPNDGVNILEEREIPSLAKEGCREAAGWFDQEFNCWTNTTLALRATPPLLRRGRSSLFQFVHTFIDARPTRFPPSMT